MKTILKNLITLKSRWIPNDPIKTFTPYIVHLVRSKKLYSTQIEDLANEFEKYYGFSATSFLIKNVLSHLIDISVCERTNSTYNFVINKLKPLDTISQRDLDTYVDNVNDLINDFIDYCGKPSIAFDEAEKVIIDFVKEYDQDLLFTEKGVINNDDNPALKFFWIEYVKEKIQLNNGQYRTILMMCEGNIIKSLMFDEVDSNNIYPDTKIFIDTPIIFRLLGYYGEYLKKEYEFLFDTWKRQGGSFYIYEHNLNECVSVLRTAEEWVEAKEIDLARTSDICIYFREIGYSQEDVALEIETIEKKLKDLGIKKHLMDFDTDSSFMEDSQAIRDMILTQYNRRATFDSTDHTNTMIDIDAKSILYSYYLREDNNIHSMREAKLIYLTSNSGLFRVANKYQKAKYGQSISPVQLDSFMGMVICLNDYKNISKVTENRVISHCYSAYKPSRALKETYNEKLLEMLTNKDITNEDYYLLKHHNVITQQLVKGTCGVAANIDNETVFDFLKNVKIHLIEDVQKKSQKEIDKIKFESQRDKDDIKIKYEKIIVKKDASFNTVVQEKKLKYDSKVKEEFSSFIKSVKRLYFIVLFIVTFYLLYNAIFGLFGGNNATGFIISSIIMSLFTFGQLVFYSVKVTEFFNKIFILKQKQIEKKFEDILL